MGWLDGQQPDPLPAGPRQPRLGPPHLTSQIDRSPFLNRPTAFLGAPDGLDKTWPESTRSQPRSRTDMPQLLRSRSTRISYPNKPEDPMQVLQPGACLNCSPTIPHYTSNADSLILTSINRPTRVGCTIATTRSVVYRSLSPSRLSVMPPGLSPVTGFAYDPSVQCWASPWMLLHL